MGIGQTLEGACPLRCEGYWYGNIGWDLACQLVLSVIWSATLGRHIKLYNTVRKIAC